MQNTNFKYFLFHVNGIVIRTTLLEVETTF